ncbi:MAG: hypothetical protein ACRYGI_06860 [Janthinobacterium lividum]
MDRLSPITAEEPTIAPTGGSGAVRSTVYAALAIMIAAGAWVRFNDTIATLSPTFAAPAAGVEQQHRGQADAGQPSGLLEIGLLPQDAAATAVATMGLPQGDATSMMADLKRDRLRLVRLPLFDAGPATPDGLLGRAVQVSSGGYSRLVHLTRQPILVTLPIDHIGTVSFKVAGADPVGIGALTLAGPVELPVLSSGQQLDVGVVAQ